MRRNFLPELFRRSRSNPSHSTSKGETDTTPLQLPAKRKALFTAACLAFICACWFVVLHNNKVLKKYRNTILSAAADKETEKLYGMDKAAAFDIERTKNPVTGKVPWEKLRIAIEETEKAKAIQRMTADALTPLVWSERGPDGDFSRLSGNVRPNNDQTGGRIRAIMVDSLDPSHKTVFAGSVSGGLWKTTDITVAPANWMPVNDFLSNLAIGDICQDPRPGFQHIMYLCTGESYFNADAVRGVGVFKSTDAGANWTFLPSTNTFLNGTKIICDFQGNVYLGTRGSGLQRSADGGLTWSNITPSGLTPDIADLEISSTAGPARLHVTTGIFSASGYRYTDNAATVTSTTGWVSATTPFTTFNQRTEMAISGNVLYALPNDASNHEVPSIWKTIDGGVNWTPTAANPPAGWASQQGWYALSIGINPANSNECIVGGLECYKTINGGASWSKISVWVGGSGQYVHADQHDVQWWDGGNKLLFACDGGLHYSSDGGTTIRDRNKGLRIKQFYSLAIHPNEVNYIIAGAQDNGMHRLNHPGLDSSIEFYGGDGMYSAIDQDQPQFQFGAAFNNNIRRSVNGGLSWSNISFPNGRFVSPWDYDNAGNVMYICNVAGSFLRWNNPQGGVVSSNIVTVPSFAGGNVSAVHVSPYTANRVYFGTGIGGIIAVDNANAGTNLTGTTLTPAGAAGFVNCVVTGSSDQFLMACYSNYGINNVWISKDGGTSWSACDGNLPDMPVRWGLFHPDDNTKAYIATETGVWETDLLDGSSTVWVPNTSFPNVKTDMLKFRRSDRLIGAATHGRGIWTANIPFLGGFELGFPAPLVSSCPAPGNLSISLTTSYLNGSSSTPISFTASGAPAGTTILPIASVMPGNPAIVTLSGAQTLRAGTYTIHVTGTAAGSPSITRDLVFVITALPSPIITLQPGPAEVCAGGTATFSTAGTSSQPLLFEWQVSTDGGASWSPIPGAASATYTLTNIAASLNGSLYRVQLSNASCTVPVVSQAASLTVRALPAVSLTASQTTLYPGNIASLKASPGTSPGGQLQFSWTYNGNPLPVNGLVYEATVEQTGVYQVRLRENWPGGLSCSNLSQPLTLTAPASSRLFIYPNPNDGRFTVSYYNSGGNSSKRTVTVYDAKGATVKVARFTVAGNYTLLPIVMRPAQKGVYIVMVRDEKGGRLAEGKMLIQ